MAKHEESMRHATILRLNKTGQKPVVSSILQKQQHPNIHRILL